MIQVLTRAIDILEALGKPPQGPKAVAQLAQSTGLHPATCVRILKTLASRGLIEQAGRKQGYSFGPALYALVAGAPYRADLVQAAQGPAHRLAMQLREPVVVNILQQGKLLRVLGIEGQHAVQVSAAVLESGDPYTRCTGRILLSHLAAEQLDEHVQRAGLPGDRWPGAGVLRDLRLRLAEVRQAPLVQDISGEVAALACPILQEDLAVAAIGVYLPAQRFTGAHRRQILRSLPEAANDISALLSHKQSNAKEQ